MGISTKGWVNEVHFDESREVWKMSFGYIHLLSRRELLKFISENQDADYRLTHAEAADLKILREEIEPTVWLKAEAAFVNSGFSWTEMEEWVAGCYRMNLNPLPTLRKILGDIPVYYEDDPDSCPPYGLSCIVEDDQPLILLAHGTLNELAQDLASRKAFRKRNLAIRKALSKIEE